MASPNIVTTLALNEPATLLAMVGKARPAPSFLLNRYFPCNEASDIYPTENILLDYRDKAGRKLAPLVHKGFKSSARRSFYTDKLTPARIAPKRELRLADLVKRGFAEEIFSGKTAEQRAFDMTMSDVTDLIDEVNRRLEYMAADLLVNNQYTLTYEKSDDNGADETSGDVVVSFVDAENANESRYTPETLWNSGKGNIYADIKAMARQLDDNGGDAVDLVLGSDAADALLRDAHILELLNNRRMEMGNVAPAIREQGATLIGLLNVDGILLNVIEYREKYTDASGSLAPFIPAGCAVITSPGAGRSLFAAVNQMESFDERFHSYPNRIVPKYLGDARQDKLEIMMTSRPLLAPVVKGGWVSSTVTGNVAPL